MSTEETSKLNTQSQGSTSNVQGQDQDLKINRKGFIETKGEIVELLPGLKFKVELENGHEIMATMAGRMRIHRITIVVGDKVKIEMSPYDVGKGRITYRF